MNKILLIIALVVICSTVLVESGGGSSVSHTLKMTKRQAVNYTAVVDQGIIDYCERLEKIDPDVCINTLSDLFRNVCQIPDDIYETLFDRIHDGYECMLTPGNQFLKLMEDHYCQGKTDPQCGLKLFKHCTGVYVVKDKMQFPGMG